MKRLLASFCFLLLVSVTGKAIDLEGLEPIGPVSGFTRSASAVLFRCADGSQVQVSVLAPDLVRVRASFKKPLPARDHSWAIAKTDWGATRWNVTEQADAIVIATDEVEVVVRRAPLLVEFRDAKTHEPINADFKPMMRDPKTDAVAAAKRLGYEERFYGLGEKAARLDKRRGQFTNWNSDTPAYKEGTDPIYQTIPFYIGLENGRAYGLFFDNSYRSHFDFGASSQEYIAFSADGGEMNYYFFHGPSMQKVIGRYTELTGRMPMVPMWALGHQQSRWSYYPQSVAEYVVRRYREEDLPLDVLYLDIHYMQGYRVFTWDTTRYPDPKAFTDNLRRQGVKVIPIVDPGVKYQPPARGATDAAAKPELTPQDKSYYVFNQGVAKDYFVRRKNGDLYVGAVWPGKAVFTDFTREDVRRWWGGLYRAYTDNGVAGIWTDMNEPSDFVDKSGESQVDLVFDDEGERSMYAKNRNVFALLMARATYEGLMRLQPDARPYVITRAGYAGYQRYTTMWTGDNTATWETLQLSIPMYTTMGLSGVPFVGGDVGGFIGRTDAELLTRWYEAGFLTPMLRNHQQIDTYDHEPWRFGKVYEDIIRKYLKLRYRLLPFLYTQLEDAHRTGLPLFRPLVLNYQSDPNVLTIDDEFMIGTDLLVAPVMKPDVNARRVYLPAGEWVDYWTNKRIRGGALIQADAPIDVVPMYVRAGAVIPMGPEMNYVGEKPFDPLTLVVYPGAKGEAAASIYEDDGMTQGYRQGVFRRTSVSAARSGAGMQIKISAPEGSYNAGARGITAVVKSASRPAAIALDGKPLAARSAAARGAGWSQSGDDLVIQIADDGRAHTIQ
ncbi:MAG TPA: TIM-barrel domain-containing protein, partial [Blastocatellia bacterium]|nr:TIM-barrel domain-containing protein [Blastocatellia bacterium]